MELSLQSAQSSAVWVGTEDGGGKMNIDVHPNPNQKKNTYYVY